MSRFFQGNKHETWNGDAVLHAGAGDNVETDTFSCDGKKVNHSLHVNVKPEYVNLGCILC